ncbi:SDR family oxidoreductase [Stagnimonas aquatica]|uniref:SDR family oxidoreductase n=1 Tax=Stagnimonas aquatica TaxID=2689987 RepID=A0A3N0V1P8_9GAMM|nr:SDR family oxidoreductase [Stagnimonas aquatica]ROH86690.1 SDR family oxidoreductase [Stagnimonas aquatica]
MSTPPQVAPAYVPAHGLLKGRSVLITAAAGGGIGFAAAKRCLEEGARALMLSDIHPRRTAEAAEALAKEFPDAQVFGQVGNVAVEADVQALIEAAEDKLGGVDVLINNAGLGGSKRVVDMSDEEWQKVLDVTLTGTFRMTRAMLKKMQPRGRGAIVNNASVLGWRAQKEQAHYAAAKAGVMALTRCSALEAADYGVRINAVSPSIVFHDHLRKSAPESLLKELAAREAFGRGAEAWEIANIMVFLASDYSSYLVGETISASSQRA